MNPIFHKISKLVLICCAALIMNSGFAGTEQATPAAKYYPFEGKWKGEAEMAEPGQAAIKLDMTLACRKVSSGWAIACDMNAKNKDMMISESDLMGVDPDTGKGHWYAISSMGETHDHQSEWTDANTMNAHYSWQKDGKLMEEKVVFNFMGKKSVKFHSVVTVDGQVAGEFSGSLKK